MKRLVDEIYNEVQERLNDAERIELIQRLENEAKNDLLFKIFVLMPFGDSRLNYIFFNHIKDPLEEDGHTVIRVDDFVRGTSILDDILKCIKDADLIIAELTGNNLNVYYELGRAHGYGKENIIQICQMKPEQLPFDIRGIRTIQYEDTKKSLFDLLDKIFLLIEKIREIRIKSLNN
jgi:hypothetical protein